MPLPRASGKKRNNNQPPISEPTSGLRSRRSGTGGHQKLAHAFGEADESNNDQSNKGADDQREHQQDFVFVFPQIDSASRRLPGRSDLVSPTALELINPLSQPTLGDSIGPVECKLMHDSARWPLITVRFRSTACFASFRLPWTSCDSRQDRHPAFSVEMVRAELSRILGSSIFTSSQRLSRFLQFVVERANEGKADELKEYAIGIEVFERRSGFTTPASTLSSEFKPPKFISKLLEYYNSEGRNDALVISIPKGGYVPVFQCAEPLVVKSTDRALASVAVLPFINMSPEPDDEYFSDGLTEEVINALTSVPGLQVVARLSVFRFKGQQHDVREIGGQLDAGTILEGSVRKAGTQLRITAQLVSVKDGYHLWSHTFKRELRDVLAVQEEISEAVREALAPHFGVEPALTRAQRREPSLEAHELYLKGRYAQARLVGGSVAQRESFSSRRSLPIPITRGLIPGWRMPGSCWPFGESSVLMTPFRRLRQRHKRLWNSTRDCRRPTFRSVPSKAATNGVGRGTEQHRQGAAIGPGFRKRLRGVRQSSAGPQRPG